MIIKPCNKKCLKLSKEVQQKYDGDGHSLKIINSTQVIETPLPSPVVETKYQIWSSVMNTTLTELRENGSKAETKVFAGGAVIAKQYGNATQGIVRWIHADPVTGSSQEVEKSGQSYDYLRTELEPLGQEVEPIKPDEEISTGTTVSNNSADSPEWLCKIQYKDYWDMPVACQRARNEDVTDKLEELRKKEGNVVAITGTDSPMASPAIPFMDSPVGGKSNPMTLALRKTASSTTKTTKDNEDDDEPIVIETRERKIPGFKDASDDDEDDYLEPPPIKRKLPKGVFRGGISNPVAQLADCLSLRVASFDMLKKENPAALTLLNNTYGDEAKTKYTSLDVYDKAVLLNTAAAAQSAKVNLTSVKFTSFYAANGTSNGLFVTGLKDESHQRLDLKPASVEIEKDDDGRVHIDVDLYHPIGKHFFDHQGEIKFNNNNKRGTHPGDVVLQLLTGNIFTGVTCQN